jgi:hypothetical protein
MSRCYRRIPVLQACAYAVLRVEKVRKLGGFTLLQSTTSAGWLFCLKNVERSIIISFFFKTIFNKKIDKLKKIRRITPKNLINFSSIREFKKKYFSRLDLAIEE